ncbi:MAG: thymidylate synthase [Patescibacteria group bacterium]
MEKQHEEYQYLDLLREILNKGVRKVDRGTGDASYSVFGRQMRFDLCQGFPLLTTKKVYWKGVLHELYWFVSGQSNIKYLVDHNVHIWDDYPYRIYVEQMSKVKARTQKLISKEEFIQKIATDPDFAEKWGNLPKIYGELWRKWPAFAPSGLRRGKPSTIDQLAWVIQEIQDDPAAHNLIVTSWNPEYLYTMATKENASRFPICHNMYQVNIINGKLSLQLYQRSADLFLGVPFNIASYALLTLILAKVTGYEPGEFIHTFGDVHIYEMHLNQIREQLEREPRKFPHIHFNAEFKTIEEFRPPYVELVGYDPHPAIKAALSVTGGVYDENLKKLKNMQQAKK